MTSPVTPLWRPRDARRYSMRYREDLDNVLKDISVRIPAGHKVLLQPPYDLTC